MMSGLIVTPHAAARLRQRGYADGDLDWLLEIAVETRDGLYVTQKQARALASRYRKLADRIEHLAGTFLVVENGRLITIYRPNRRKANEVLRGSRRHTRKGR